MRIDLRSLLRQRGFRRRLEIARIETTRAQEQELYHTYFQVVKLWRREVNNTILPTYRRALEAQRLIQDDAGALELAIDQVQREFERLAYQLRSQVSDWLSNLQRWHQRRFIALVKSATGIDLTMYMTSSDVQQTLDDIVSRNVGLIQNVSDQLKGRIAEIVFAGLQNNTSERTIALQISKATGLAQKRAQRIVRDQTLKAGASLDRQRQLQTGMDRFMWEHSRKEHYRAEHKARDGKIFAWNSSVGRNDPPGLAPFCGCKARGVLEMD